MSDDLHEIRCVGKRHGLLLHQPGGGGAWTLEVKCDSRVCGAGRGVVVLHRWDLTTGELVSTSRFRDASRPVECQKEGVQE